VFLTGLSSGLLWEHGGEVFRGHLIALLFCLISLPVIGGILTPARPAFTAMVFAVGSFPPVTDITPIPIGLWPFVFVWKTFSPQTGFNVHMLTEFPFAVAITALAATVMLCAFMPLVCLGQAVARWFSA
jgi:hypothetical protein